MIPNADIDRVVAAALAEDAPWGDATSQAVVPPHQRAVAVLAAREAGVLAGGDVFRAAFRHTDPEIEVRLRLTDGDAFAAGDVIAEVTGPARGILTAERVALNFTQRMSGIATLTARYVAAVAGTGARIADTRKTTPGLRVLERHAVVAGGGHNHRFGLSDAVMLKDNHLAMLTEGGARLPEALRAVRDRIPHTMRIEVEIDRLDQLDEVLAGEPDVIMFDNFAPGDLAAGVERVAGRAITEASGGVSLDTVAGLAATGVDVISVGALTHSARAVDLGLDL